MNYGVRDTRRRNAAGKLIGGHYGTTYASPGWWLKRQNAKAQRRRARELISAYVDGRRAKYRSSIEFAASELNWRGT